MAGSTERGRGRKVASLDTNDMYRGSLLRALYFKDCSTMYIRHLRMDLRLLLVSIVFILLFFISVILFSSFIYFIFCGKEGRQILYASMIHVFLQS